MTKASAHTTLVKKFSNYRANRLKGKHEENSEIDAMRAAASALIDLRSFSNGKHLFQKRNKVNIALKRDQLKQAKPELASIAALQMATKQLWAEANQDYWEAQATEQSDDIYK
jgi:hypothetical protein